MNQDIVRLHACPSKGKPSQTSSLPVIKALLDAFEQHAIIHCYWKRSSRLAAALRGEKDLDLLIARSDQHKTFQVLVECGFKLFPCVFHRDHPAVLSFIGFDEPSGILVHVHLHMHLVVGEPLLKNYRLPWESELLARAVRHPELDVRVLDPASETLLTLVRGVLEHSRIDPVSARNWSATQALVWRDIAELARTELASTVEPEEFRRLSAGLLGIEITEALTDALANAIIAERPVKKIRRLRRLLLRRIGTHRLYNGIEARCRSLGRSVLAIAGLANRKALHAPRPWSRRAPGGGCIIALVGLDGSGKSTVVGALRRWLGAEVDVMPVYFGTGEGRPSLVLLPFKLLVPLGETIFRAKPKGSSHGTVTSRPPSLPYACFMTVWATMVSIEKRMKLVAARRAANRGMVVVADRYPQNEIVQFNDGPLLPRLPWVPRAFLRFERVAYDRAERMPPDLVLKLVITPDTAARREPAMDRHVIAERAEQLRGLVFPGAKVVIINAEQPLDAVIRSAKREVWNML